ncbi:M48 family metallopeptidase [Bacteroidota bacterium]
MPKIYAHPEFGEIIIVKSNRAKKISIVLKPFHEIRISIPQWVTYQQAVNVIKRREVWIRKNIEKIKRIEGKQTIFTSNTIYKTRYHNLVLKPNQTSNLKAHIKNGKIQISYPEGSKVDHPEIQKFIKKAIEETYRLEAKKYLPSRTFQLASKYGFKYEKITIRNSKTRWGSCSHKNNLSFSLHVMRLPDSLIDLIILHELMHTKIKNHSKNFWMELEKIIPNVKKQNKELKRYRITVY